MALPPALLIRQPGVVADFRSAAERVVAMVQIFVKPRRPLAGEIDLSRCRLPREDGADQHGRKPSSALD